MNQFLQILMTQLQNQNPLEPMDANEFTSQLVGYSQLEQQINTNTTLEDLGAKLGQLTQLSALSYLGTTAEIDSPMAPVQGGEASWSYELDATAASAAVTVLNADGDVVYSGSVDGSAGKHGLSLSLDDLEGVSEGDVLTLQVSATDADGDAVGTTVTAYATATSVTTGDTTTYQAGDLTWSADDILKIHDSALN
jgi:flagellar basal-body rod modification protein FlgD